MSHPVSGRVLAIALALGSELAGAACSTVDLGESPVSPGACRPDPAYFDDTLWPEYLAPAGASASCVGQSGCHRIEDGRSALRLTTDPLDLDRNYDVVTRFIDCGAPEASSLYTKPLDSVDPHGGGDLFGADDAAAAVFLDWLAP
jgi:hypothetical protein